MFVVDEGPPGGPAVLLLHGAASSLHAWDALVPMLSADVRVLRVDLLGHGRTGGGTTDATGQAMAIAAVLDERVVTGVTVVGHSFGADVAVALGASNGRVDRVVLLAQGPDYTDAAVPRLRFLTDRPVLVRRLHGALRPILRTLSGTRVVARYPVIAQGMLDIRDTDAGMLRFTLADRRETLGRHPLDAQLTAVAKPALVVLGGRDRLYGDRGAARYRAAGARVEVIADSGHAMPQQHPAAVAELLRAFHRRT